MQQDSFNILMILNMREILNCITSNCISHTCVSWQGTNYELPGDDTTVSKHAGAV
jgi:hypothetical protein